MKTKGIYYLLQDEEIVYIGKSLSNMRNRTNQHSEDTDKIFNYIEYYEIENDSDIHLVEIAMITKHKPKYNKDSNSGASVRGNR